MVIGYELESTVSLVVPGSAEENVGAGWKYDGVVNALDMVLVVMVLPYMVEVTEIGVEVEIAVLAMALQLWKYSQSPTYAPAVTKQNQGGNVRVRRAHFGGLLSSG